MDFDNTKYVLFLEIKLLHTICINKTYIIQSLEISDLFRFFNMKKYKVKYIICMYIFKIQIMGFHNTKFVYFLGVTLLCTTYINKA